MGKLVHKGNLRAILWDYFYKYIEFLKFTLDNEEKK